MTSHPLPPTENPLPALEVELAPASIEKLREPRGAIQASRRSTFSTQYSGDNTVSEVFMLLGASVKRESAIVTVIGQASDIGFIAGSREDAKGAADGFAETMTGDAAVVMGGMVVPVYGCGEIWIGIPPASSVAVGVIPTYQD